VLVAMPNLRHGNTRLLGFLHHCSLLLVGEAAGSIARPLTLPPILFLKGISTGDFSEALAALLGKDAAGLSA
jgi:hypothetical protein